MNISEFVNEIEKILDDKKAVDVKILSIKGKPVIADYFIIATGTSTTHVNALADEVEFQMKQRGVRLNNREGKSSNTWILLDYGDVVVHVFLPESREYYNIEKLWGSVKNE